jgi:hypothetical protein
VNESDSAGPIYDEGRNNAAAERNRQLRRELARLRNENATLRGQLQTLREICADCKRPWTRKRQE